MSPKVAADQLRHTQAFFNRGIRELTEADSGFAPAPPMLTAAQQVAHVADTVEWFIAGALSDDWKFDFDASMASAKSVTSLAEAKTWLDRAFAAAIAAVESQPAGRLDEPMAPNPILGPVPRRQVLGGIIDHTAHHRGALAVYTRLLGKVPPMPYADAPPA